MFIERADIKQNIISIKKPDFYNDSKMLEGRKRAIEAGTFLKTSGINDAVIDFRQGFLGEMGNLTNKIDVEDGGLSSSASIILEWIDPDDLRHLILKVTAGNNSYREKYISASFREIPHHKKWKHDPYLMEISVLHLGKELNLSDPVSKNGKMRYKRWLREKILNYEHVWGDV